MRSWEIVIPVLGIIVLGYTLFRNVWPLPHGAAWWGPSVAIAWFVIGIVLVLAGQPRRSSAGEMLIQADGLTRREPRRRRPRRRETDYATTVQPVARGQRTDGRRQAGRILQRQLEDAATSVATTFVDHSGAARMKAVPLAQLANAARFGLGYSPVIDAFISDGSIDPASPLDRPDGDLRMVPDLDGLVALATPRAGRGHRVIGSTRTVPSMSTPSARSPERR